MNQSGIKYPFAVVHFQQLEKFPPAMNLLNFFEDQGVRAVAFTTGSNGGPKHSNQLHRVYRLGKSARKNALVRYLDFAIFNLVTLFQLCRYRPTHVFYYDTLSVWPAYIYKLIFPSTTMMVHHHEYMTPAEYAVSSQYLRWLHKMEEKALLKASWVSQTNCDRLRLFSEDHPKVSKQKLKLFPNYPPLKWFKTAVATGEKTSGALSFVYVGSLGLKDSYIVEFATWVNKMRGLVTLDIFTGNITPDAREFMQNPGSSFIRLRPAVSYYDLPSILSAYDVGLVLYKGANLNMKYNVPNKIMEYYSCGLAVWCSDKLVSTSSFKNENCLDGIRMIDFEALDKRLLDQPKREVPVKNAEAFCCETVYGQVLDWIKNPRPVEIARKKTKMEFTQ